ncbi:DUF1320 domain-containing protein [Flavobacterium cerinum]|nr:DUF1320 domain-containing protein [Flavobacterium cerinum]
MRFLNDNDYKKVIRQWIKNLISYESEDVLEDAELAAQSEMETYLVSRYDTQAIFNTGQEPEQRSALIVMYLVDMALYHLHANIQPNDVPEVRENRYKQAISWLKDVAAGKISPVLPVKVIVPGEDNTGNIALGCNPKVSERF